MRGRRSALVWASRLPRPADWTGSFRRSLGCVCVALALGCGAEAGEYGESAEALTVCAAGPTVEGIDVSVYQGLIDWNQVKGSNVKFAVTRISDGLNFKDSYFDTNWPAIEAAGLIRGAYQYFEPALDAAAQADMVVQKVGKLGPNDLPVQLDMEATGGQSSSVIVAQMKIWIDRVTAGTGKRPIIYTGRFFWDDNVNSTEFASHPLWIANYGVSCPSLPSAWSQWRIWQYGDNGTVAGIDGAVDVDKFNGTLDDLHRFAAGAAAYSAQYVSQSFPLASRGMTMTAGQSIPAYIELRNTGTKTWDSNTRLATSNPRDRSSAFAAPDWLSPNRLAAVKGTVAPGATYRFDFTLHAPSLPGTYAEYLNLVQEGVTWFSQADQGGPPDDQLQDKIQVLSGGDSGSDAAAFADGATISEGGGGFAHDGDTESADGAGTGSGGGKTNDAEVDTGAGVDGHGGCGCRLAAPLHSQTLAPSPSLILLLCVRRFRRRRGPREGALRVDQSCDRPRCVSVRHNV